MLIYIYIYISAYYTHKEKEPRQEISCILEELK